MSLPWTDLVNSNLHVAGLIIELAPDVDVGSACSHGAACHQAALHQLVWVVAHDLAVLARARLALISIHYQVLWSTVRPDRHNTLL